MGTVTRTEHKLTEQPYRCGHCGIDALMFIVSEGEHTINEETSHYAVWFSTTYKILLCPSCNSANVIKISSDSEGIDFDGADETIFETTVEYLYPHIKSGNFKNLPSLVEKSYAIAIKLKKIEPIASVIFSRKSLDAICVDQKALGRDLKEKIDNLAEKGAIPSLLKDAAHSLCDYNRETTPLNNLEYKAEEKMTWLQSKSG